MRMRNLLMGLLIGAAAQGVARADMLDIVVPTKAGVSPPNAIAEIKVDGASQHGPYDSVTNKTLDYIVSVRGDKPKKATGAGWLNIYLGDGTVDGAITTDWKYYAISAPYQDPWSNQVANVRLSPVDMCNERLNQTSGQAREAFLKKGVSFGYKAAYSITGDVEWWIKKPFGFKEPKHYTGGTLAPVNITCMNLDRPRPRKDTSTKGPPPHPGKPMPPTISEVSLRVEPAQIVQDGKFLCPSQLKLYGHVEAIRKFYGQALFVGPHYLSNITTLNFQAKGNRNVTGTYTMDWHPQGGLTTAQNAEPTKQKLTFRFNVADKDGKLLDSAEKTVEVSCRKIKVNAPTAGDGMTINP
jgi:hypothetical protein